MATSKVILLQKAVRNITLDGSFRNRWVSASSLEKALTLRYQFDSTITISKATLSRAVGKINPCIDTQNLKHASGMYRGVLGNEKFYFVQDSDLVPPIFPITTSNKSNKLVWDKIKKEDERELQDYMNRIEHRHSRQREKNES